METSSVPAPDAAAGTGACDEESLPGQVICGGDVSGGGQGGSRSEPEGKDDSPAHSEDAYSIESVKDKKDSQGAALRPGRFLLPPLHLGAKSGSNTNDNSGTSFASIPPPSIAGSDRDTSMVATRDTSVLSPPTRNMSLASGCSRRSFLEQGNTGALQRLAAAGVRTSALPDLAEDRDTGGFCGKCWFRFRRLRFQTWLFLEEPFLSVPSCIMSSVMVLTILASICDSVWTRRKSSKASASSNDASAWADRAFNLVFSAEIALRLWAFPDRCYFFRHPKNAIDMVSVLPFFINDVVGLPRQFSSLAFLQWLSTYEAFLRLLKLSRYFWGWQLLFRAVGDSAKALVIPLFFLVLIVILGSCTLYMFEMSLQDAQGGDNDAWGTPSVGSLPDCIHFAILCVLSMSTGPFYGKQAASFGGQLTVIALMVFGMLFMAMPIAIVGSCFSETWFDQDRIVLLEKLRSCLLAQGYTWQNLAEVFDEVDEDNSGELEFNEFKKLIKTFHVRSLNIAKCRRLFHYFDTDGDGVINFTDFALTLYPDLPLEGDQEDVTDDEAGEPPMLPFQKVHSMHRRNSVHSVHSSASAVSRRKKNSSENPQTKDNPAGSSHDSTEVASFSANSMKSPRRTGSSKKSSLSMASRSSSMRSQRSFAVAIRDKMCFLLQKPEPKPDMHFGASSSRADGGEEPSQDNLTRSASPAPSIGITPVLKDDSFAERMSSSMAPSIADARSAPSRVSNASWHSHCFSEASWWTRDASSVQGAAGSYSVQDVQGSCAVSRLEFMLHRMERRVERRLDQLNSCMIRQASRPASGLGFLMGFGDGSAKVSKAHMLGMNRFNRSLPSSTNQSRRASHQSMASGISTFPNLLAPPRPRTGKMRQNAPTGSTLSSSAQLRSRSPSPSDEVSVPGSQNS